MVSTAPREGRRTLSVGRASDRSSRLQMWSAGGPPWGGSDPSNTRQVAHCLHRCRAATTAADSVLAELLGSPVSPPVAGKPTRANGKATRAQLSATECRVQLDSDLD